MAEALGLASTIMAIAGVGVSVTTTLYTFSTSYTGADRKVEGIATTVSVTAAILTDLGNAAEEHPTELQKINRWSLFPQTTAACRKDFDILATALVKARKGQRDNAKKMTPWERLKWAIGGENSINDLLDSLERSKSNLQLLLNASNFDILKKLEKS